MFLLLLAVVGESGMGIGMAVRLLRFHRWDRWGVGVVGGSGGFGGVGRVVGLFVGGGWVLESDWGYSLCRQSPKFSLIKAVVSVGSSF